MPATTPNPNKGKPEEPTKWRYAKCDLTAGQKEDLKRWREGIASLEALAEWVDKHVANGHTLTLRSQEVGYQATLSGVREASGHKDISLVARSRSPMNAVFSLQYKDEVILHGKWEAQDWTSDLDL